MDGPQVADAGQPGLVEQGGGDAQHGQVDQPGDPQADEAVPRAVGQQGAAFGGPGRPAETFMRKLLLLRPTL